MLLLEGLGLFSFKKMVPNLSFNSFWLGRVGEVSFFTRPESPSALKVLEK